MSIENEAWRLRLKVKTPKIKTLLMECEKQKVYGIWIDAAKGIVAPTKKNDENTPPDISSFHL